jgi:outer membrane protein OmpA-like peptidoglycan-associated protein
MKTLILTFALISQFGIFAQSCFAPVEVLVTDLNKKPYAGDKIVFYGKKNHKVVSGISNVKGVFVVQLPCGDTYDIKVSSVGEEQDYNTLEIPTLGPGEAFQGMKLHVYYELPEEFTLQDLKFETSKAVIQSSSFPSLNLVADFLKRKPTMQIEIGGHTDSDGDDKMNLQLSKDRANAVKTYLISKGVSEKQMIAIGYGETRPIAENTSTSGKQQNRRTEIQILKK